ncbi:MAG: DinB family protein [Acidimicrobiales bacterium]
MTDRHDPDLAVGELESLQQYLDYQRATMVRLTEGLTPEQWRIALAPSTLTLAGLVKHLALVEDAWFVDTFLGQGSPEPWTDVDWDADPDWEFRTALDDAPETLLALYATACDRARAAVAGAGSLDALSVGLSRRPETAGQQFSLRWILLHMIEETARHLGHADLIRQSIDGATDL